MTAFAPIRLPSGLEVGNRVWLAPMTTYSSQPNGVIADDELPYLERRAAGGFGAILSAACCVHPTGWAFRGQWQCSDDQYLDSLGRAAEAIHRGGARAILQIHHGGRQCPPDLCGGQPVSASAIAADRPNAVVPRALSHAEIEEIIAAFASAARRARTAGYDGVEIHGANTYLLQQFVSPHSNRREDVWGQDRLKFPLAVTDAVLAAVPGFSVGYRFSPEEPESPGIRIADTGGLIAALGQRDLDYLHVSLRRYDQGSIHDAFPGTTAAHLRAQIPAAIPFITSGGVRQADDLPGALAHAEITVVGRAGVSDPEWVRHARLGETCRDRLPAARFAEVCTVPAGLAAKIDAVPGWFEFESASA
ncbi:MAG: hypothetical protein SFX74_07020 [Fimbriimonadaceae bacterium]|nr:hypothetical protein [Fimbriimonadaceae bacterium]